MIGLANSTTKIKSNDIGNGIYNVKVIDFDGTIIDEKNVNANTVYTLPTPPTHDKLVFQEWSSPNIISNNTITVNSNVIVGPIYTTTSGLNELDIKLTLVTRLLAMTLLSNPDYGDPSVTDGAYNDFGEYTITGENPPQNPRIMLSPIVRKSSSTNGPGYKVKYARAGTLTTIGSGWFARQRAMKYITISNAIQTMIMQSSFYECMSLETLIFPNTLTLINDAACESCHSLKYVIIPNNMTTISVGAFYACYSLTSIIFPNSITSIDSIAFGNCFSIKEYDFSLATSIPTLVASDAFQGINKLCKIKVPSNLYSSWITATNWSTYADYIVAV